MSLLGTRTSSFDLDQSTPKTHIQNIATIATPWQPSNASPFSNIFY